MKLQNKKYSKQFYNIKINFIDPMTEVKRSPSVPTFDQRCKQSNNKCICQICTCGKHRCPQPHVPFQGESTQHHDYKQYNVKVERAHRCAYKLADSHYNPELIKSTYRDNYKPFKCPAVQRCQKYAYQPNKTKFEASTEYHDRYVQNKILVERPAYCQSQYKPSTVHFTAKSTYAEQFKAKKVENDILKKHYAYQKNESPFYGKSTYEQAFKPYQVNIERPHTACFGNYTTNKVRFEGKSTYADFYKAPVVEKQPCRCLIEQLPQRPRECSPGKDHVHFDAGKYKWN